MYKAFLGRPLDITKRASGDICAYSVNHIRDSNNMVCDTQGDPFSLRKGKVTFFCSPCIFMRSFVRLASLVMLQKKTLAPRGKSCDNETV